MKVQKTKLKDVFLIKPKVFHDNRGYFFESFNAKAFQQLTKIKANFKQDNQSLSSKNVLRGLHFQKPPYAQAKIVSVIKGEVLDVVVDIRKNSNTYGQHIIENLSEDNHHQLYIPEGMAHGFLTLSDETIFCYKCSDYYNKEAEDSILWNDESLNINWGHLIQLFQKKINKPKILVLL